MILAPRMISQNAFSFHDTLMLQFSLYMTRVIFSVLAFVSSAQRDTLIPQAIAGSYRPLWESEPGAL